MPVPVVSATGTDVAGAKAHAVVGRNLIQNDGASGTIAAEFARIDADGNVLQSIFLAGAEYIESGQKLGVLGMNEKRFITIESREEQPLHFQMFGERGDPHHFGFRAWDTSGQDWLPPDFPPPNGSTQNAVTWTTWVGEKGDLPGQPGQPALSQEDWRLLMIAAGGVAGGVGGDVVDAL